MVKEGSSVVIGTSPFELECIDGGVLFGGVPRLAREGKEPGWGDLDVTVNQRYEVRLQPNSLLIPVGDEKYFLVDPYPTFTPRAYGIDRSAITGIILTSMHYSIVKGLAERCGFYPGRDTYKKATIFVHEAILSEARDPPNHKRRVYQDYTERGFPLKNLDEMIDYLGPRLCQVSDGELLNGVQGIDVIANESNGEFSIVQVSKNGERVMFAGLAMPTYLHCQYPHLTSSLGVSDKAQLDTKDYILKTATSMIGGGHIVIFGYTLHDKTSVYIDFYDSERVRFKDVDRNLTRTGHSTRLQE